ncbi:MAG: hypothetical protein ABSE95_11625 [Thermodesulfobacteriota bacterium]|jgi:hypothetical protein
MKKINFLMLLGVALLSGFGCSFSQNMINPEGQGVRCHSAGW